MKLKTLNTIALSLALAPMFCAPVFADVIQSTSHSGTDSWSPTHWISVELGGVTLATGTNNILALTSSVTLVDQGWGNQAYNNGVQIELFVDGQNAYNFFVASADHSWSTQTYDITANLATLTGLNAVLSSIVWGVNTDVKLVLDATPQGWPGWELHTRNASFSVTSEVAAVPVPAAIWLFASGLLGLGALRKKAQA